MASFARRFPIDTRMPQMKKAGGIGESFDAYIAHLLTSDDKYLIETAAPIVGAVYDSMLREGMAFPGKKSRLKEMQESKTKGE